MATTLGEPARARKTAAPATRAGAAGMPCGVTSAGLAVLRVLVAAGAELRQLKPVRVVAAVLLGDVVALLAVHARHRDLGADVGALAGHGATCSRNSRKNYGYGACRRQTRARSDAPDYAIPGVNPKSRW